MHDKLPKTFINQIERTYGSKGTMWLKSLPSIIDACRKKWSLALEESDYELNYNFIASVRRKDGTKAILKIGYRLENEMEALRAFDGKHSVQLLDADPERGALLLERIDPGYTLESMQKQNDDDATIIGAEVIRSLAIPVPTSSFPHLRDWCNIFKSTLQSASDIPSDLLRQGIEMFDQLDAKKPKDFLLHGDLHHTNILFDVHRGWLAIDPKGVIGPKAFNAARFLGNPPSSTVTEEILHSRITLLANALNESGKTLAEYGFIDALLSMCWSLEDGEDIEKDLQYAHRILSLSQSL